MFRRWVLAACIAGVGACIAFFFLDIKPVSVLCSEGFALLARKGGDATENAEAAYNKFDRAVSLAPSCAVCYFGRGVSLYRQFYFWAKTNILDIEHPGLSEDIAQIMWDNLTKAIELDPNLAEAYFFRGLVTLNLLARSKSVDIDDFSAALSLNDPQSTHWGLYTHEDIYYWRGMAWARREGCLNEAIADFSSAISLDSTYVGAYFQRGLAYEALGGKELLAIKDFDAVISLDPTSTTPYYHRAVLRAQLGQYDGAIADMERLVDSIDCAFTNALDRSYPDLNQDESLCKKGEELLAQWRAR